jgi:hypothetical protein
LTLSSPAIRKLPLEVQSVLAKLASIERELISESKENGSVFSGDYIVGRLVGREAYTMNSLAREYLQLDPPPRREPQPRPEGVAVIPGFTSGNCQPIVIVVMGVYDDQEKLLLETIEYISARCRGATKYVIFYAITWNGMAWANHRDSIRASKVVPILKLLGSESAILNPLY